MFINLLFFSFVFHYYYYISKYAMHIYNGYKERNDMLHELMFNMHIFCNKFQIVFIIISSSILS